jgi:hypothetical protein
MARPSIDHLFDCQIRIWRANINSDSVGVEEREYEVLEVVDAFINRPVQPLANLGGGLAPTGGVRWYGRPDISVYTRDVCEVLTGPERDLLLEVNAPPVRPKNHHTQVDCIEWHGILPEIDEGS